VNGPSAHPELRAALLAEFEERAQKVDRDRVAAAFDFADQAHGDQRRESGQPFISHAVEVCRILLDLLETRLDTTLACATLLHDVVEDTAITPADLEKRFGKEVAGLVEGVTKLSGLHFDSREAAQAENFRKMLLSMSRDLRVIFIKLADRLHNMRTLEYLKADRAHRIAAETRDIYAPLAHRLGMAGIKRELEDLSLKALDPDAYQELIRLYPTSEYAAQSQEQMKTVLDNLAEHEFIRAEDLVRAQFTAAQQGDDEGALASTRSVLGDVLVNLARLYSEQGRMQEAGEHWNELRAVDPGRPELPENGAEPPPQSVPPPKDPGVPDKPAGGGR
jgi:(p)ppGpp synthase/HD superfamily hydrolase